MWDAGVRARDQLLGVATSARRVVARRGGRREASQLGSGDSVEAGTGGGMAQEVCAA